MSRVIATILQAAGVLTVAAGFGFLWVWAGLMALGVGMAMFGIALERAAEASEPSKSR
jgi:hypothetical protein